MGEKFKENTIKTVWNIRELINKHAFRVKHNYKDKYSINKLVRGPITHS